MRRSSSRCTGCIWAALLVAVEAQGDCPGVVHDLWIPLVAYFFLTLAVGLAGLVWTLYARYRHSDASLGGVMSMEGGSMAFMKGDYNEAGEPDGPAKPRESWQINFRELKFGPRIGVGNVGEVYKGTYRGRLVAIKKLLGGWYKDDDMVARFREEIMLMSRMNHPNVLKFIGAVLDRDAGNICLVTEMCERGSLHDVLHTDAEREPLSWQLRLNMAREVALGMDYLHSKAGIIQRDLKSANLLVTREYEVKIADFGLSRRLAAPGRMQTYCGTPATMAPEIVRQEDYDEKADVYSFGIIMWELLTRAEPYEGQPSGLALAYSVANEGVRPPIPAYCPYEWAVLMAACWADDPAQRPTFDEIQRVLFEHLRLFDDNVAAAAMGSLGKNSGTAGAAGGKKGKLAPWVNSTGLVYVGPGGESKRQGGNGRGSVGSGSAGDGTDISGPSSASASAAGVGLGPLPPQRGSGRFSRRLIGALPASFRPKSMRASTGSELADLAESGNSSSPRETSRIEHRASSPRIERANSNLVAAISGYAGERDSVPMEIKGGASSSRRSIRGSASAKGDAAGRVPQQQRSESPLAALGGGNRNGATTPTAEESANGNGLFSRGSGILAAGITAVTGSFKRVMSRSSLATANTGTDPPPPSGSNGFVTEEARRSIRVRSSLGPPASAMAAASTLNGPPVVYAHDPGGSYGLSGVPDDAIAVTMDSQPESDDASRVGSVSAVKTVSSASVSTGASGGTTKGIDC